MIITNTSMTWQQFAFYALTSLTFIALIIFGKVDITAAMTAIALLFGHAAGTISATGASTTGATNNAGNNATASKTISEETLP
jgi:hypothetical protein